MYPQFSPTTTQLVVTKAVKEATPLEKTLSSCMTNNSIVRVCIDLSFINFRTQQHQRHPLVESRETNSLAKQLSLSYAVLKRHLNQSTKLLRLEVTSIPEEPLINPPMASTVTVNNMLFESLHKQGFENWMVLLQCS